MTQALVELDPAISRIETDPVPHEPDSHVMRPLGAGALDQIGILRPEQADNLKSGEMHGAINKAPNPEGDHNAELFKQAYDKAVESIEDAFKADSGDLEGELAAILNSIDELSGTPYISSAPEFVDLVKAARSNVERIRLRVASGTSLEVSLAVADALAEAKQQLDATTIAYWPR